MTFILITVYCSSDNQPFSGEYPKSFQLIIESSSDLERNDALITVDLEDILAVHPDFNPEAFIILNNVLELPSQANDLNNDDLPDEMVSWCSVPPQSTTTLTVRFAPDGRKSRQYVKRTQAELSVKVGGKFIQRKYEGGDFKNVDYLRVPPEHTDHSNYIRYEGPGWESDKVGYRFYLDWRNGFDIFGKKVSHMVLQNIGLDGFESYHHMSDWGMDVLKVGSALGIGGMGIWLDGKAQRVSETDSIDCRITANGPVQSSILTHYFGWKAGDVKCDLTSKLTIEAGSRLTRNDLEITGNPPNLCTGLVNLDSVSVFHSSEATGQWRYLATWGKQSLNNDNLGMAVIFRNSDQPEINQDQHNLAVILKPTDGKVTYYFLAAWEKEPEGVTSELQFRQDLDNTIRQLDTPLKVSIK